MKGVQIADSFYLFYNFGISAGCIDMIVPISGKTVEPFFPQTIGLELAHQAKIGIDAAHETFNYLHSGPARAHPIVVLHNGKVEVCLCAMAHANSIRFYIRAQPFQAFGVVQ